jgi:2-polyprenyl-3-methyl-5-hydroxy-6-metoxy-1,4-benzoquinol methylase
MNSDPPSSLRYVTGISDGLGCEMSRDSTDDGRSAHGHVNGRPTSRFATIRVVDRIELRCGVPQVQRRHADRASPRPNCSLAYKRTETVMSRQERWQLSGDAAAFYERYVRLIMEPWVRRVVDVAALRPAEHVLDVACGTGFVARLAADRIGRDGRVVGVDLNAGMIEAARAASTADIGNTIEWRIGDAAVLPFANAAFDVVLCQQGVQFFPDRSQGLREMR